MNVPKTVHIAQARRAKAEVLASHFLERTLEFQQQILTEHRGCARPRPVVWVILGLGFPLAGVAHSKAWGMRHGQGIEMTLRSHISQEESLCTALWNQHGFRSS